MQKQTVEFISSEETLDLRSRILRPGQNLQLCRYPEDNLPSTFHLAIKDKGLVIANGTFIQQAHTNYFQQARFPYRLRGMATDIKFQKQGLGRQIIQNALKELERRGCDLLWFNARVNAEDFYKKLGFIATGDPFELPLIGPHKVMYIDFKNR